MRTQGADDVLQAELAPGIALGASDWQFADGEPISVRVDGHMQTPAAAAPLAAGRVLGLAAAAFGLADAPPPGSDASFACAGFRFRFHSYTASAGRYCFTLRRLAGAVPDLDDLGVPAAFARSALAASHGLILVSGPTGAGKSTTLAAAVNRLNRDRAALIITLEDPIEFRHPPQRSVIRQLEKGTDFTTYADALQGALRADPDILLVGELRDRETMAAALSAAETGHLVLATVHAATATEAIARITGAGDASAAGEIRTQLSQQLVAVLAQQLVRGPRGKAHAAFELLLATPGVKRLIVDPDRRLSLLANEIGTGSSHGMVAMDQSLEALCRCGAITRQEAARAASIAPEWPRCA